jgi:hypothetical protein
LNPPTPSDAHPASAAIADITNVLFMVRLSPARKVPPVGHCLLDV